MCGDGGRSYSGLIAINPEGAAGANALPPIDGTFPLTRLVATDDLDPVHPSRSPQIPTVHRANPGAPLLTVTEGEAGKR